MADKEWKRTAYVKHGGTGGFWFLGFVGAAVYYIQQSSTFWGGVGGVIKALFWPAFLIYQVFKVLHM